MSTNTTRRGFFARMAGLAAVGVLRTPIVRGLLEEAPATIRASAVLGRAATVAPLSAATAPLAAVAGVTHSVLGEEGTYTTEEWLEELERVGMDALDAMPDVEIPEVHE